MSLCTKNYVGKWGCEKMCAVVFLDLVFLVLLIPMALSGELYFESQSVEVSVPSELTPRQEGLVEEKQLDELEGERDQGRRRDRDPSRPHPRDRLLHRLHLPVSPSAINSLVDQSALRVTHP